MAQNLKKLPLFNKYSVLHILKKSNKNYSQSNLYIFRKSLTILSDFSDLHIMIYKGNLFRKILVNKYLIGYKFGGFTHTRKPFNYPIVKKKKKNLRR